MSELPTPPAKISAITATFDGVLSMMASSPSAVAITSWPDCNVMSRRRRSNRSATTPPGTVNTSIGTIWANIAKPTQAPWCVRRSMKMPMTNVCIQLPTLEPSWPSQTIRKARCDRAALAEPGRAGWMSPSSSDSSTSSGW